MRDELDFFVGVDWGTTLPQICILDTPGEVVCERRVEHSGKAIGELLNFLAELTNHQTHRLAVAIELPGGPVVEAFLERG